MLKVTIHSCSSRFFFPEEDPSMHAQAYYWIRQVYAKMQINIGPSIYHDHDQGKINNNNRQNHLKKNLFVQQFVCYVPSCKYIEIYITDVS